MRHYGWEACVGLLINHFSQTRGREIDLTYRPKYEGLLYAFMSKKKNLQRNTEDDVETTNVATYRIPGNTRRRYFEALSNLVTNYLYNWSDARQKKREKEKKKQTDLGHRVNIQSILSEKEIELIKSSKFTSISTKWRLRENWCVMTRKRFALNSNEIWV